MNKILYTLEDVKRLVSEGSTVLIDGGDPESYKIDHLPGAVNIPEISSFLAESTTPGLEKMQNLFKDAFSRAGISHDKKVIMYEDGWEVLCRSNCRGYFLLKYLGHPDVGILESGLVAWANEDLPLESGEGDNEPAEFTVNLRPDMMATKEDVLTAIEDPSIKLLDNRDKPEWLGTIASPKGAPVVPRAGRIPTARWIEWYDFLDQSSHNLVFKSKKEIQALCGQIGFYPQDDIIIYCFKGRRAANTYVALKTAGFKKLRVYFASWNEWSRDLDLPVTEGVPVEHWKKYAN